jgi:putative DNA primase/helicase
LGWKPGAVVVTDAPSYGPLSPAERAAVAAAGAPTLDEGEPVSPIPANAPPPPTRHFEYGEPAARWIYRDADGAELFHVLRFDFPDRRKEFCPLTLWRNAKGSRWRWKALPAPRPLYGLDRLATCPDATVIVCEGEKTADAAARIFPKHVIVTSSGGAQAAAKTDWEPLQGRKVIIWPDNDEPGTSYALEVAAILNQVGGEVSVIDAATLVQIDGGKQGPDRKIDGWDAANALAEWRDVSALSDAAQTLARPFERGPRYVSYGAFVMTADGLEIETRGRSETDTIRRQRVSGPFEILGRSRNAQGGDWGLWLRWHDGDTRLHSRLVASAALHGEPAALCQSLASEGLHIERSRQRALADYLNGADVCERVTRVERTGWHSIGGHEVFVLPTETIGPPSTETVVLDGAANAPYEKSGSLEDWRDGVGALASGHFMPVLAISVAFAGPLLHMAGGEGGGIHVYGQSPRARQRSLKRRLRSGVEVRHPGS